MMMGSIPELEQSPESGVEGFFWTEWPLQVEPDAPKHLVPAESLHLVV